MKFGSIFPKIHKPSLYLGLAGGGTLAMIANKIRILHDEKERAKDKETKERIMKEIEEERDKERRIRELAKGE